MFKTNSIFYDMNIISKIICIVIIGISFSLLRMPAYLVFFGLFLLIIAFEFKKTSIFAMIGILLSILATFYEKIFFIPKIILFIVYIYLVKKITKASELRYLLEKTLYKFQSKRITFKIIYIIYFFKQLQKNMRILDRLRDEYGMANDFFYFRFSLVKSWKKTRYEMKELITMNNLRFYNYSKQRTYVEKPTWEKWDTKYLLFHIAVLIFFVVYGR